MQKCDLTASSVTALPNRNIGPLWPVSVSDQPYLPDPFPWCWKRDDGGLSRSIYYKPVLDNPGVSLQDVRFDFFYSHTADAVDLTQASSDLKRAAMVDDRFHFSAEEQGNRVTLIFQTKELSSDSRAIIRRLLELRPRKTIPKGVFPTPTQERFVLSTNTVLYAGSGVSYESGLPTLADIHEYFGVDNMRMDSFIFGRDDPVPERLGSDPRRFLEGALEFYVLAARAQPSFVHGRISELQRKGKLNCVVTDNLDRLFERAGISSIRSRTVFPHSCGVDVGFIERLLVVGVSADRRGIIAAAREAGARIICVNPNSAVSPRAQNLSYLTDRDIWYKCTADDFFRRYVRP